MKKEILATLRALVVVFALLVAMNGWLTTWRTGETSEPAVISESSEVWVEPAAEIAETQMPIAVETATLTTTVATTSTTKNATTASAATVSAATVSAATANTMTASLDISGGASLSGQLVMIDHSLYPEHKIVLFDLESEETTTLFEVPENGWVYQLDVSPDGSQVAMAYAAPPSSSQVENQDDAPQPYDRSGIYLFSLDDPAPDPQLLLVPFQVTSCTLGKKIGTKKRRDEVTRSSSKSSFVFAKQSLATTF